MFIFERFLNEPYFCMKQRFKIELLPEAVEFLENLDNKSREKIYYNLKKAQFTKSNELFKKLNEFIWEFRTLYNNKTFRLFAFWERTSEQETLIITTHGIVKKTNKTPIKEIKKAEEIRSRYLEHKSKKK